MKIKTIILISIVLTILTISAVSASESSENITPDADNMLAVSDVDDSTISSDGEDPEENDTSYTEVAVKVPDEVEIGSNDEIEIQLPDDAVGNVAIFVNNTQRANLQVNGEEDNDVSYSLDDLGCGLFWVKATFTPTNGKYGVVTDEKLVNITYNITIDADDVYIYGKAGNLVYVTAPPDILMQVIVKINNVQYALTNVANTTSKGYIDISNFVVGTYKIEASFAGNEKYEPYTANDTTQVITGIDVLDYEIIYNSDAYISLVLPGNSNGTLVLSMNNQVVDTASFVNGVARIKFPTSKIGQYYYNVTFTGDEYNITKVTNKYVNIVPKITVPGQMTVGEDRYMTIEYNANAAATFQIAADGEYYATLTSPGSISLKDLDDGEISLSVEYFYNSFWTSYDFDVLVNSVPFRFVGVKTINMNYGDSVTYPLTLYGTNGKLLEEDDSIEIKIGKKTYDAFTNSRGVVNFKIPSSVLPGKYTVFLSYDDGDDIFTATSSLVVKQSVNLKKVAVKSSAKSLVLSANLKNLKKNLIKNKKIIFKFNGKKYTAKTNAKGVAKVTIKENVLKKLKAGKKITYQATFLKNTVKQTVKVKK